VRREGQGVMLEKRNLSEAKAMAPHEQSINVDAGEKKVLTRWSGKIGVPTHSVDN